MLTMRLCVACGTLSTLFGFSLAIEASRVVGIADLHGDFDHTIILLKGAGLIEVDASEAAEVLSEDGHPFSQYRGGVKWIGGNSTLVQTGDLVDRGTYARDLYALFADLRSQAKAAGGRVVNLVGNHDMMNVLQDLRYVSREDYAEFGGQTPRAAAFAPTGWIGRQILEDFQAVVVAGDTLFVHAGLLPIHAKDGTDALNTEARDQLRAAAQIVINGGTRSGRGSLLQASGPFWLRHFAMSKETKMCEDLQETLALVGAKRMMIGHTQVDEGHVRLRCNKQLLMADTIISKNGYPECWESDSMSKEGCEASLSYVEIIGKQAFAVTVPVGDAASAESMEVTKVDVSQEEL